MRLLILIYSCSWLTLSAQENASVILVTNIKSTVRVDGIEHGTTEPGSVFRLTVTPGEHYIEAQDASEDGETKGEIVSLEPGGQKIVKFEFSPVNASSSDKLIDVAEISFSIPGTLAVATWVSQNPDKPYPYPTFMYAFEKGDEIVLDVTTENVKGTNKVTIATYPDGVVRYTNQSFTSLSDLSITVPERSIYSFTFLSNYILPRDGHLKISRRPVSEETASFNPKVTYKAILTPVQILEPQYLFVNGGLNAIFKGGKSRVTIPITLPENTVEWFYRFAASRNQQDIEQVQSTYSLLGELTRLVLNLSATGAIATSLAADALQQPPGADYCDVMLLDREEVSAFESKVPYNYYQQGSRENLKSGNIKVTCCRRGTYYLGIRNPSSDLGINVSIEAVAITARYDYVMERTD